LTAQRRPNRGANRGQGGSGGANIREDGVDFGVQPIEDAGRFRHRRQHMLRRGSVLRRLSDLRYRPRDPGRPRQLLHHRHAIRVASERGEGLAPVTQRPKRTVAADQPSRREPSAGAAPTVPRSGRRFCIATVMPCNSTRIDVTRVIHAGPVMGRGDDRTAASPNA